MILDDSFQNKQHSKSIELVNLQYSGAEHGLVRGIGVVSLFHTNGEYGGYYPIDFRICDRESDGKTKNTRFLEMLVRAVADKQIKAKTILFDTWYGSVGYLKAIHRMGCSS